MPVDTEIVKVEYPSEAYPGQRVEVKVRVHNKGDAGPVYVRFTNLGTGETDAAGTGELLHCRIWQVAYSFIMPSRDVRLKITTGEGRKDRPWEPASPPTDTETITIKAKAGPPPAPKYPRFILDKNYTPSEITAAPGENVEIPVKFKNVGEASGTCILQLRNLATNIVISSHYTTSSHTPRQEHYY